jgi:hypothetical protein
MGIWLGPYRKHAKSQKMWNTGTQNQGNHMAITRMSSVSESVLDGAQNGFRKLWSCTDCVFISNHKIEKRELKSPTLSTLLDWKEPIDKVIRQNSEKWLLMGFPPHLIGLVQILYLNMEISVCKEESEMGRTAEICKGVRWRYPNLTLICV